MPKNTLAQAVVSSRLLRTKAPSREIGANRPPCLSIGARHANSDSEPAMKNARMTRMNTPRRGSLAKACTEVSTPERTRNVPSRENEKARIARKIVHTFSASRFSITATECRKAVPASQGMRDAFSTGSQNRNRPTQACNRPSTSPSRCRASGSPRRSARTGERNAPTQRQFGPRSGPPPRTKTRSRSRHSRDRAAADGWRGPDPAGSD